MKKPDKKVQGMTQQAQELQYLKKQLLEKDKTIAALKKEIEDLKTVSVIDEQPVGIGLRD